MCAQKEVHSVASNFLSPNRISNFANNYSLQGQQFRDSVKNKDNRDV